MIGTGLAARGSRREAQGDRHIVRVCNSGSFRLSIFSLNTQNLPVVFKITPQNQLPVRKEQSNNIRSHRKIRVKLQDNPLAGLFFRKLYNF
jgi:hypothetical protein